MSLLPYLLEDFYAPRLLDQIQPIDILALISKQQTEDDLKNRLEKNLSIQHDKDKFQAIIDVQQFKPEELTVKVNKDRTVTVEGKHEEKQDEHGFISRHFVRKYLLPEDCDVNQVISKLSSDGVLSITAPKKPQANQVEFVQIPVVRTGQPARKIEQKEGQGDSS
ncbi:heat shock protein 27-like [Sitophilus oryzae]|uniref:Heat shock protein 27-like n=1 Tax=Sitophilus oryzae TaxID=7048 RepID=A0A6J2Y0I9_SITOR|nr:heat shock protein 27-like [Sitophilus oryzae]